MSFTCSTKVKAMIGFLFPENGSNGYHVENPDSGQFTPEHFHLEIDHRHRSRQA